MRARERARGINAAKKCKSLVAEKFMKVKSEMSEIFTHYFIEETQEHRRVVFRGLRRNVRNLGLHTGKNSGQKNFFFKLIFFREFARFPVGGQAHCHF